MPAYTGPGYPIPLYQNRQAILLQSEVPVVNRASIAVQLLHGQWRGNTGRVSVSCIFAADPGAYQFNIEGANDDVDAQYVPISGLGPGSTTTTSFASFIDLQNPSVRYIRVRPVVVPNAVACTLLLSRT